MINRRFRLQKKRIALVAALLSSSLLLSSCSLFLSDYKRPTLPEISSYNALQLNTAALPTRYWEVFSDPLLNVVIEKALSGNFDLERTALKVQKARIAADLSDQDRYVNVQSSLSADAGRALSHHDSLQKSSDSSFAISYQADLFGRIEAQNRTAYEEYGAAVYDDQAMRLTVVENTAKAYWKYAYCKKAVLIMQECVEDSQKRVSLVRSKFNAGAADASQLDTARINDLKMQNSLEEAKSELAQARTALNILLGEGADRDHEVFLPDGAAVKAFPLDVPSALLEKRPDLMASEARLRAALSKTDEALSAFFPQLTFSAGIKAGSATTFADFLANPLGSLGAVLTLPFVNFHRLSLERQSALKDHEIAQVDFVSSYVNAVKEVYDAVTLVSFDEKKLSNAKAQYALAAVNYDRIFARYRVGTSSLSELLDAADDKRNSSLASSESVRALLSDEIALMAALGGGVPQ